jgi:ATP-dependent Clp protease ATP-binding subunit ClpB
MTSNIGSSLIQEYAGRDEETMKVAVMEALKRHFRPEFLNRLDDVIVFHALDRDQIKQIVDIQVTRLNKRLANNKLTLVLDSNARNLLAAEGYAPSYGARPLKRAIQRLIENPLAMEIISRKFEPGQTIQATADGDHLRFAAKAA